MPMRLAIATAEDRGLFRAAMTEIGLAVPDSGFANDLEEALEIGERVGFPGDRPAVLHIGRRRHRDSDGHGRACAWRRQTASMPARSARS